MPPDLPATITQAVTPFVEGAVEEVRAALTEYEFEKRQLTLKMWWEIGGIIREWRDAAQKELGCFVPLEPFCVMITEKVGRGKESGYKAVQFREHFPTEESLEELPFGKAASWGLVVNKVLPALNAGKSLDEIAIEDRKEMDKKRASQPVLLYDGPGNLNVVDGEWIVEFPQGTQLKGWPGQEVDLALRKRWRKR